MVVSVQSPAQAVVARIIAAAEATAFKPGQVLEALVLGKTPEGMTALKIGDLVINAQLPQTLPAGTSLQLQVKVGGPTPQLVIVTPPTVPVAPQQPLPLPTTSPLPPIVPQATAEIARPSVAPQLVATPPMVVVEKGGATQPQPSLASGTPPQLPVAAGQPPVLPPSLPTQTAAPAARSAPSQPAVAPPPTPTPRPIVPSSPTLNIESEQPVAPPTARAAGSAPPPPAQTSASLPASSTAAAPAASTSVQPPPQPGTPLASSPAPTTAVAAQLASTPAPAPTSPPPGAPITPQPPATASVPSAEPEAANPLLVAQGAPRPTATMADLPRAPPKTLMQTTPPQPATPQAALAQMVPEAMAKQNSLAPLLVSLASIATRSSALPEPVVRAALQLLAQRVALPASGPTADLLKAAIAKSGVYLEASLAKAAPPVGGDIKAGLLALKGALATSLGGNPAPVAAAHQAAPPLKGMPPRAEPTLPPQPPEAPRDLARALHSQADAAVSRVKLMQLASLPDADPIRGQGTELRTELPFLIGNELVMAQLQIFRDGRQGKADAGKRGWTMRFAMNFSQMGEVGAEVGIMGKAVNVVLWANEPETAEQLSASLPDLKQSLAALGLDPGAVRIRSAPPEVPKPAMGHFLDSMS